MILDAGVLISVDRGERGALALLAAESAVRPLHTTHAVVAQVWRDGARQARLAKFLKAVTVHPLDDGKEVGQLIARAATSDVVDAHLVHLAVRLDDDVMTGDFDDLNAISDSLGAPGPTVHPWPA